MVEQQIKINNLTLIKLSVSWTWSNRVAPSWRHRCYESLVVMKDSIFKKASIFGNKMSKRSLLIISNDIQYYGTTEVLNDIYLSNARSNQRLLCIAPIRWKMVFPSGPISLGSILPSRISSWTFRIMISISSCLNSSGSSLRSENDNEELRSSLDVVELMGN